MSITKNTAREELSRRIEDLKSEKQSVRDAGMRDAEELRRRNTCIIDVLGEKRCR